MDGGEEEVWNVMRDDRWRDGQYIFPHIIRIYG